LFATITGGGKTLPTALDGFYDTAVEPVFGNSAEFHKALHIEDCFGDCVMVNYESIFFFILSIARGRSLRTDPSIRYYHDGFFGAPKYILSFGIVFSSIVVAESVTLTLISKVQFAPRQMKNYTTDSSFVVIFTSAMARLVGDLLIYAFQNRPFYNDLVNPLSFTLMVAITAGLYVVLLCFDYVKSSCNKL
jgi:hypothetical protein